MKCDARQKVLSTVKHKALQKKKTERKQCLLDEWIILESKRRREEKKTKFKKLGTTWVPNGAKRKTLPRMKSNS